MQIKLSSPKKRENLHTQEDMSYSLGSSGIIIWVVLPFEPKPFHGSITSVTGVVS